MVEGCRSKDNCWYCGVSFASETSLFFNTVEIVFFVPEWEWHTVKKYRCRFYTYVVNTEALVLVFNLEKIEVAGRLGITNNVLITVRVYPYKQQIKSSINIAPTSRAFTFWVIHFLATKITTNSFLSRVVYKTTTMG